MTGPQTKVLQGYGSLGHQHAKPDEAEKHPGKHLHFCLSVLCVFGFCQSIS